MKIFSQIWIFSFSSWPSSPPQARRRPRPSLVSSCSFRPLKTRQIVTLSKFNFFFVMCQTRSNLYLKKIFSISPSRRFRLHLPNRNSKSSLQRVRNRWPLYFNWQKKSLFIFFSSIKCNAVYEQSKTGPRLSQVRSFGILRSSSRTASSSVSVTKAENPTYNLYVKKLEGMKITLDPSTHLFFSSSKSSSLLSGLRVIELGCFQELARMLNSSASAHKVMTLDESRLKIVTIYGEIKLVNPSQVAEERVKRELVGDSLMKKFEQVKNWFSDKSNALLGSALVSTLIPKTDN